MGKSTILAIDELAEGQEQAYVTVNDMVAALEEASNLSLPIVTDVNYSVAQLDTVRFISFRFSGMTANRNVTFPAFVNSNTTNRLVYVINSSASHSLIVSSGGVTTVRVPPSSARGIQIEGTVVREVAQAGKLTGIGHNVALFAYGLPTHDTEVLRYIFTEAVTWGIDFAGSRGTAATSPSPGCAFYVYKNGSLVGRILVNSGGTFTFLAATAVSWAIGDVLSVKYEALQIGSIVFNSVADTNDQVSINNGTDTPVIFTFGGGGGQVAPGATAVDSAINLQLAIEASALASSLRVSRSGNTLTIINLLEARGGVITKTDADNDLTINTFTSDASGATYGITFTGER